MAAKTEWSEGLPEPVSKRFSAAKTKFRAPKSRPVRVVHISNPTMVQTSASEFRAVVQSLTGLKRSSTSDTALSSSTTTSLHASEDLSFDSHENPAYKVARFGDELDCCNPMKSDSIVHSHNNNNKEEEDDAHIPNEGHQFMVSPVEIPDMFSHQMFETLESIGDTRFFGVEIFSPSILFSEFELFKSFDVI